jgi:hypothetical protein
MRPEDVARIFGKAGEIQMIQGMFAERRATGRAWVTYTTGAGAESALAMHKTEIDGRFVEVYPPWSRPARQALRQVAQSQQSRGPYDDDGEFGRRFEDRRGRSPMPYREGDMYESRGRNRRDDSFSARSPSMRSESAAPWRQTGERSSTPAPTAVCVHMCMRVTESVFAV